MPNTDPSDRKAYNQAYHASRQLRINIEHARMGLHTSISLAWPRAQLSEASAMWIAGVIDCEGCLHLGSHLNKKRGGYNFSLTAQVAMTDLGVIDKLLERYPRLLALAVHQGAIQGREPS